MRDRRRVIRVGTLLACVLVAAQAGAEPRPPTEADRLFEEGRALAKRGDHAGACAKFEKSFELDSGIGTELNLADCHEKLGHLRLAWRLFLAAADESQRSDDAKRTAFARGRADALAAKLAEVVVSIATPTVSGLAITISGHPIEPGPVVRDRTEPGEIEVVATVPGRPPFRTTVHGEAGATVEVSVPPFGPAIAEPPPPPPVVPREITQRRKRRVRLALGLGLGAGGLAVASTVLVLIGRDDYRDAVGGAHCAQGPMGLACDPTGQAAIDTAQRKADIGTVLAVGSGLLLVGAAAAYFTAPRDRVLLAPTAGADRVGIAVHGAF